MNVTFLPNRILIGAAMLAVTSVAAATATTCYHEEQPFARLAIAQSNAEIRMSEVAALRASADSVRQFARAMVDDHGRARRELKELALSRDIGMCWEGLTRRAAHQVSALQRYVGIEFDREYLTQQIHQHRRTLLLYRQHALANPDEGVRFFAESRLSVLEAHLQRAQTLAENR